MSAGERLRAYRLPGTVPEGSIRGFSKLHLIYDRQRQVGWAEPVPDQSTLDSFYANDFRRVMGKATDAPSYLGNRYYRLRAGSQVGWVKAVAKEQGTWLDVGAGFGVLLSEVRDRLPGWSRVALEPDQNAQPYLKEIAEVQADFGAFWEGRLFGPEQFDVISLSHVLEHLIDPAAALGVIFECLKPGGHLLLEVPHDDFSELMSEKRASDLPHLWFFSEAGLRQMVETAGMRCVRSGVMGVRRAGDGPGLARRALRRLNRLWLGGGQDAWEKDWYKEAGDRCDLRVLAVKPEN